MQHHKSESASGAAEWDDLKSVLNHHPEFYIKHLVNHKNTTELFHDNTVNNQQHHYKSALAYRYFLGLPFPTGKILNLPNMSPACWLASDTIISWRENKSRIKKCGKAISMSGSNYHQSTLYFLIVKWTWAGTSSVLLLYDHLNVSLAHKTVVVSSNWILITRAKI